ncbi:MAG: phosphoadenylyl-sulfate reductase [Bacteroidota bacterium]
MTQNIRTKLGKLQQGGITSREVDELNAIFTPLDFKQRIATLYKYFNQSEVLFTSSFGTKSVFLIHLMHQIRPDHPIYFIDTTYHFQETLAYKRQLIDRYGLKVVDIQPDAIQNELTREESWWKDHPKMCCTINKVVPLEPIVEKHEVWISGLMGYQTPFRAHLRVFEKQGDILKFHPLVDIDEGEFLFHISKYNLPPHPLEAKGYGSVGCENCTVKGKGREGRWVGSEKTECGLHPNYFNKKKN